MVQRARSGNLEDLRAVAQNFTAQSKGVFLAVLEEPFGPNSTTGHLLARMEQDAFLAGQAYIWDPPGQDRLVRLRPDWTTIVSEVVRVGAGGWYRRPVGYWHEPPKGVLDQGTGFMVPASRMARTRRPGWAPT